MKPKGMKLEHRYNLDTLGNRSQEIVLEAVAALLDEGGRLCPCEECVTDLVAWTLNHVTPRYYTSLLSPLRPDAALERKVKVEVDLAITAGLKRLREHPHHE
jgi:competence protein ComFB